MDIITREEHEQLDARLAGLKSNRPVLTVRIAEARALGDLRENAEYHAAREQQGLEEAEIRRLEDRLARAQVVEQGKQVADGVVFIGSTVRLRDLDDGDEDLFRLVDEASGSAMADFVEVTVTSPMGEALIKARVGETIRVNAPRGIKRFEIVEIVV
jgi:transcription elongation factor GreA